MSCWYCLSSISLQRTYLKRWWFQSPLAFVWMVVPVGEVSGLPGIPQPPLWLGQLPYVVIWGALPSCGAVMSARLAWPKSLRAMGFGLLDRMHSVRLVLPQATQGSSSLPCGAGVLNQSIIPMRHLFAAERAARVTGGRGPPRARPAGL